MRISIKQSTFREMYLNHYYYSGRKVPSWGDSYRYVEDFGLEWEMYYIDNVTKNTIYVYKVIDRKKFLLCSLKYNAEFELL